MAGRMHVDGTTRLGWNSKVQTHENFGELATGKVGRRWGYFSHY